MNKAKINDLYEKAHVVYEIPYEASVVEPGHIAVHKQKVWDRYLFAELIVRECVDIALEQKKWVEDMETLNLHDEIWNRARIQQSQHIVDKIKEHFGVEL